MLWQSYVIEGSIYRVKQQWGHVRKYYGTFCFILFCFSWHEVIPWFVWGYCMVDMTLLHGLHEVIVWFTWSYCMVYMMLLYGLHEVIVWFTWSYCMVYMMLLYGWHDVIAWLTWSYCMVCMRLLYGLHIAVWLAALTSWQNPQSEIYYKTIIFELICFSSLITQPNCAL